MKSNSEPKSCQCIEVLNLYVDNDDNLARCDDLFSILDFKSDYLSYAYILHNQDIYSDDTFDSNFRLLGRKGHLKKPHYHCYIKFNDSVPVDYVEKTFNLKSNDYRIFKPKDFDNKLLYLIHANNSDKFQYSFEHIKTNIPDYVKHLIYINSKHVETDVIKITLDLISKCDIDTPLSLDCVINYLYGLNVTSKDLRSNMFTINLLINEHNRHASMTSNFLEQKALEYMNEHNYFDKKIQQMIEMFGFGRVEIDNETYIVAKANKEKYK